MVVAAEIEEPTADWGADNADRGIEVADIASSETEQQVCAYVVWASAAWGDAHGVSVHDGRRKPKQCWPLDARGARPHRPMRLGSLAFVSPGLVQRCTLERSMYCA